MPLCAMSVKVPLTGLAAACLASAPSSPRDMRFVRGVAAVIQGFLNTDGRIIGHDGVANSALFELSVTNAS